jgi:hypothetical protein
MKAANPTAILSAYRVPPRMIVADSSTGWRDRPGAKPGVLRQAQHEESFSPIGFDAMLYFPHPEPVEGRMVLVQVAPDFICKALSASGG